MPDKYPSEEADRFLVRMPPGMRDRIAAEAKKHNRSMNAECVARLQSSFDTEMPAHVRREIEGYAAERRITVEEALEQLVFAGASSSAQVIVLRPAPGMTMKEMRRMFDVAKAKTQPDAAVVFYPAARKKD